MIEGGAHVGSDSCIKKCVGRLFVVNSDCDEDDGLDLPLPEAMEEDEAHNKRFSKQ